MFSKRTDWPASASALAKELQKAQPPLDLTVSNPTEAGFVYSEDSLRFLGSKARVYDPQPFGLSSARAAVAQYYRERGAECSKDDVIIAASTSELYSWLFQLLCDASDVVLVPRPSYPLLPYIAKLAGIRLASYPLSYDGTWYPQTIKRLPDRCRAVVAIAPNNPTGNFLKDHELAMLERLAHDHNAALIVDEVFSDFSLQRQPGQVRTTVGDRDCLTFTLSGLSKVGLLPQLKLAWMVISGPKRLKAVAKRRLELIADVFLSPATPTQAVLGQILKLSRSMRQRVQSRLAVNLVVLGDLVQESPISALGTEGGWSALLRLPAVRSDEAWAIRLLQNHGVAVQPGYCYDLGGCFAVVSLLTPPRVFREGIQRIVASASE